MMILAFSTDTAVSSVILALLVIASKKYGTIDINKLIRREDNAKDASEGEQ